MTTLENAKLGVRVEIRKTAEETDGALLDFDVVGRARAASSPRRTCTRTRPSATR